MLRVAYLPLITGDKDVLEITAKGGSRRIAVGGVERSGPRHERAQASGSPAKPFALSSWPGTFPNRQKASTIPIA